MKDMVDAKSRGTSHVESQLTSHFKRDPVLKVTRDMADAKSAVDEIGIGLKVVSFVKGGFHDPAVNLENNVTDYDPRER
jgi:hypothetical protein